MKNLMTLAFVFFTILGNSQILNGGFEDWVWDSNGFIPEHWEVWDFWREEAVIKDTLSSEGQFSVLLKDGVAAQHEGDCARFINGEFDIGNMVSDSIRLSFSYLGVTEWDLFPAGIRILLQGSTAQLRDEKDSISFHTKADEQEFQRYFTTIAYPIDSILYIEVKSIASTSALDGCYNTGYHWIDDLQLLYINDADLDGFSDDVDCDDSNPNINPEEIEIAYNGIDDDCNPATLDDDLDQDGFLLADDCDDNNSNINPNADEIPNNGVDEDCDGMDLVSSTYEFSNSTINIYPNPARDVVNIDVEGQLNYQISFYDLKGKLIKSSKYSTQISIEKIPQGTYLLHIMDLETEQKIVERIVIGK